MAISNAKAYYGLTSSGTATRTNVSGSATIGAAPSTIRYANANVAYSIRAIFTGTSGLMTINMLTGSTSGTTAFVAGAAQVETATIVAAGGCTSNGTMTLVLTSAGMTGSPLNVPVALTTTAHTTDALIAAAARTALSAVAVIAARFAVGGTGADITLTRIPSSTFTVPTGTLNLYLANDATLNLAIPSGLGVTAAATSANTTAGVVSDGVKLYDAAGLDWEGTTLVAISTLNAVLFQPGATSTLAVAGSTDVYSLVDGAITAFYGNGTDNVGIDSTIDITPTGVGELIINVVGTSA